MDNITTQKTEWHRILSPFLKLNSEMIHEQMLRHRLINFQDHMRRQRLLYMWHNILRQQ